MARARAGDHSWDKVNLLNTFGPLGGLLVTYLLLFLPLSMLIFHRLGKTFFPPCGLTPAKESV